jgi:hypothetical protein
MEGDEEVCGADLPGVMADGRHLAVIRAGSGADLQARDDLGEEHGRVGAAERRRPRLSEGKRSDA